MQSVVKIGLFLSMLLMPLAGCQSSELESQSSGEQSSNVTLYAKSFDWNVQLDYKQTSEGYMEVPSLEYLGKSEIKRVEVWINYQNGSSTANEIQKENMAGLGPVELTTRTKVKDWKETKDLKIKWKEGDQTFEETIKVSPEKPNY